MLIERARRGLTVVRLKGGDPFLFGRGGEEAEALADAGIPFEVVPGVTTPLGIAAYTGVPLTHRDHTSAVTFVTGHAVQAIDWDKVGHSETLVIFMGLTTFADIARELIARGRDPETPAMAVRWATPPRSGDPDRHPGHTAGAHRRTGAQAAGNHHHRRGGPASRQAQLVRAPAAVRKADRRDSRQRAGRSLTARLHALGADVVEFPTIEIRPAADYAPLDRAIAGLASYDWILFTSVNGVHSFVERLDHSAADLRDLRAKICAIGPATRDALEALHLKVDLMGKEYVAEGLLAAFEPYDLSGKRVLLPRAAVARDIIPVELGRRGAHVDVVEAYRTVVPGEAAAQASAVFGSARRPDCVTFTSSSTVRNFVDSAGLQSLAGVKVASIGPVTTRTARDLGVEVAAEAQPYTIDGLLQAILAMLN